MCAIQSAIYNLIVSYSVHNVCFSSQTLILLLIDKDVVPRDMHAPRLGEVYRQMFCYSRSGGPTSNNKRNRPLMGILDMISQQ